MENKLYIFIAICIVVAVGYILFIVLKPKKKKYMPKSQEVQQSSEYHKRYPKRARILDKEYSVEDDQDNDARYEQS